MFGGDHFCPDLSLHAVSVTSLDVEAGVLVKPAEVPGDVLLEGRLVQLGLPVYYVSQVITFEQAFVDFVIVLMLFEV
jgi:hypothetical protein